MHHGYRQKGIVVKLSSVKLHSFPLYIKPGITAATFNGVNYNFPSILSNSIEKKKKNRKEKKRKIHILIIH